MKKITGKVVSLVLALALVVTSFSATFAFAATKSETVTVTPAETALVLSNGGADASLKLPTTSVIALLAGSAKTYDHATPPVFIQEIARVSGDDILTFNVAGTSLAAQPTTAEIKLKSQTVTGSEVIAIRYAGTMTRDADTVTVNGTAQATVKVLASGSLAIGDISAAAPVEPTNGALTFTDTLAKNDTVAHQYSAFVVAPQTTTPSALAMYTPVTLETTWGTHAADAFGAEITPATSFEALAKNATAGVDVQAKLVGSGAAQEPFVRIGNYAIKFTKYASTTAAATGANSSVTAVIKVTNSVNLVDRTDIYAWHGVTWASKTYVTPDGGDQTAAKPAGDAINVTGADINLGSAALVTIHSGVVGKVQGAKPVQVDGGAVTAIGDAVTVLTVNNGNVTKSEAIANTINGGTVGSVSAAATGSVVVDATDEKVPTVVGTISAPSVSVNSTKASVKTGAITLTGTTGVTLAGSKTSVGAIDMSYYTAPLNLNGFVGTIAAPLNTKVTTLSTATGTDAVVSGAAKIPTLSLTAGKVSFTTSLQADSISGAGELDVYAGKLAVKNSITSISLRLLDSKLVAGTVVFSADAYKIYEGMFKTIGFTLEKVSTTTTDVFKIKSVDFAGIVLNKTSDKLLVGTKATYTVSAYPAGTTLPTGYTVKWDFTGGDDYFTFTTTDTTATVEAKKYESVFTSLNKGQVTATVLDQYGFPAYGYQVGTCDVEIVNKLDATYKSDTTSNVAVATKYTFKITSLNGKAPTMASGNTKVFTTALTNTIGSDYYFTITAVGKVGESAGIYVNGEARLVVATIKANFKSDTTSNITVKGAYTYAITAAATPTFAVGTPSAFTAAFVSKTGDKYLYKITSVGKVGTAAGIYVNGVKVNVATVG